MLARFCRLDHSQRPILWVIGLFLVQAIPATIIRASNLEEGRIIAMARGALEDGHWLAPFVYGERFIERPVLASWLAAMLGSVTGEVTLWSLRIPHLTFFLIGTLLIYALLRRNGASQSGSVFGAFCWICMPMVAAKFINAEVDVVLSTLLFAAFALWWQATAREQATWRTWLGVGLLLALAGLTKGPQPLAYFTLGVGGFVLFRERDQIAGFAGANALAALIVGSWYVVVYEPRDLDIWVAHSRLSDETTLATKVLDHLDFVKSVIGEMLPGTILLGPAIAIARDGTARRSRDLLLAALLYSLACTLFLIVWPGGLAARFAMPATMTLAVICGLMFDQWRDEHPRVIISTLVVAYLIFGGFLLRGWVAMPFWPHLFKESQIAGRAIADALRTNPGPLYVIGRTTDHNMLVYVRGPIRAVTVGDLARLDRPAAAVMLPDEERSLRDQNPRLTISGIANIVSQRRPFRILAIRPEPSP